MTEEQAKALLDPASDENGVAVIDGVGAKYFRWSVYPDAENHCELHYIFASSPVWKTVLAANRHDITAIQRIVTQNGKMYGPSCRNGTLRCRIR